MSKKAILLSTVSGAGVIGGEILPEAVSLDGFTDFLSRASDLTGNTNSKTLTFGCWLYNDGNRLTMYGASTGATSTNHFRFEAGDDNTLTFQIYDGAAQLTAYTTAKVFPKNTWVNFLISIDTDNQSGCKAYVGDTEISVTYSNFPTGELLDLTHTDHYIGALPYNTSFLSTGRLAHVFLDYTYRDLSIEANRRLFITADGKPADPAGLIALNPIAYFQLTDPATAHINSGTGGDMVQNGTLDLASLGPNQENCVASEFDGSVDYLENTSYSATDSKLFVFACIFSTVTTSTDYMIHFVDGTTERGFIKVGQGEIWMRLYNSSNSQIFQIVNYKFGESSSRITSLALSLDMDDSNSFNLMINGSFHSVTPSTFVTGEVVDITRDKIRIGIDDNIAKSKGTLGEVYFHNVLIDLAAFWDTEANRPKPISQVVSETGVTPIIGMPIRADNPGANTYGSGGDFTEFSAPFVGARGGSEFWSRGVVVDSSNYLTGSIFCQSLVKWKSLDGGVTWTPTYLNATTVTNIGNGTDNGVVAFYWGTSENINWALEANKNRVTDQLGFPKDMDKLMSDNPSSVLAIDFSDIDNFGLNKLGADFTETGTITAGADVIA